MVFGNLGESSGTGVAFTRDPASGQTGAYGDYLSNAQGEDVVAGIRNTLSLDDLKALDPASHKRADEGDAPARDALPRSVRHRVHHRARQVVDAADPGRQAHRRGGVPDRRAAGRRAPDHDGRGVVPGVGQPTGVADVPAVRPLGSPRAADDGDGRLAGCRRGPRGLRLAYGQAVGGPWRAGGPGPQGNQPRRPRGHDRLGRNPHRAWREDLARGRRRPRDGQDMRLRCRGARCRHLDANRTGRHGADRGGRRDQHRRLHRRDLPRSDAGGAVSGGDLHRGRSGDGAEGGRRRDRRTGQIGRPVADPRRRPPAPRDPRQRRHRRGRGPREIPWRAGHRPVPHRAHVPRAIAGS